MNPMMTTKVLRHSECGVVLFFALVALVAMSLAAVALIRAVDTNSMISGNISFKQSTLVSADQGVETAIAWTNGNTALLNADSTGNGYYATSILDAKTLVDSSGFSNGIDSQGNQIIYIVQRMCTAAGAPTPATCLYGPLSDDIACDYGSGNPLPPYCLPNPGPAYRVTSRVAGPKNTVSYIQAFIY